MNNLDDLLDEFKERSENYVSSSRSLWEGTEDDDIYSVDIHIWRKPGMGASLQTICGNEVSILTAVSSLIHTLLIKEAVSEDALRYGIDMAFKDYDKEKDK